jgi:serine/threonine protein kinase
MNSKKHIQQRLNQLEEQYKLQDDKLNRMRRAYIIENDVTVKFRLENQIQIEEDELEGIEKKIVKLTQKAYEEDFYRNPRPLWKIYEKKDEIGAGAFAVVYKVRNRSTENISALKVLCPDNQHFSIETRGMDKVIKRFWQEGKILGILGRDPGNHIVKVMNMGKSIDDQYYIEMEYTCA